MSVVRRNVRPKRPLFSSELHPVDDLTIRVAHRVCAAVHMRPCDCAQRGLHQVCDVMKNAAQHAFAEIVGK